MMGGFNFYQIYQKSLNLILFIITNLKTLHISLGRTSTSLIDSLGWKYLRGLLSDTEITKNRI